MLTILLVSVQFVQFKILEGGKNMKIYLTTENGAYIAEIDELLYKDISGKISLNKKYKTYSTFYNEKMKMTEIKIKTDGLKQYLKDNFIKIGNSSIDINIEKN